jgi:hypothetical protein
MGNNRGMKVQSAGINRLSRIKIQPPNRLETFPIVQRKGVEKWGRYRTKRVILEMYDEMAEAMRTGKPYQTRPPRTRGAVIL